MPPHPSLFPFLERVTSNVSFAPFSPGMVVWQTALANNLEKEASKCIKKALAGVEANNVDRNWRRIRNLRVLWRNCALWWHLPQSMDLLRCGCLQHVFSQWFCYILLPFFFALLSVVDICTCQVGLEIFQVLEDQIEGERESNKKTKRNLSVVKRGPINQFKQQVWTC